MMNDCNRHHYKVFMFAICVYVFNIELCEIVRLFHCKCTRTARLRVLTFPLSVTFWWSRTGVKLYYKFFFLVIQRHFKSGGIPELYTYYARVFFRAAADMFCQKLVLSSAPFSLTVHVHFKNLFTLYVLCCTFDMFMREICESYSLIMMFIMRKSCV